MHSMQNEMDYTNTSWKVIVSTAVSFLLATSGILLRFVSRWLARKRLEANDYLIILAYPFKLAIDISSVLLIVYGIGKPVNTVSSGDLISYLKILYIGPVFYAGAIAFTKLSILFLYHAAFTSAKYIRYSVYALSTILVCWGLACSLVAIFACTPIDKSWYINNAGRCIDYRSYYYGLQIPNIVTDFAILLLPLKAIVDLQLPIRQTIQMSGVLLLFVVVIVFDIIRLVVLLRLPVAGGGNFTQYQVGLSIWTDLEPSVAMLVACLPIMRPLLHPRHFLRLRKERSYDDGRQVDIEDTAVRTVKADSHMEMTNSELMSSDESSSHNL